MDDEASEKIWRWNVNPTWHHCTSMYQESHFAENADDQQERYHHFRACLYFGIGTVESFLNEEIRDFMKDQGHDEEAINEEIKNKNIGNKLKEYLPRITEKAIDIPNDMREVFDAFRDMRNEVTHPSHEDHSIYQELDEANSKVLVQTVTEFLALVYEAKQERFPFWILGWNYVGSDGDPTKLTMGNYMNCFMPSLYSLGFDVPSGEAGKVENFVDNNFTTLDKFRDWRSKLQNLDKNIEPFDERFPQKPRLTNEWWNDELITQTRT